MDSRNASVARRIAADWVGPLAVAFAYHGAATAALALATGPNGIAVVWPSSGILFAALLLAPPSTRARDVAAAAMSLLANLGTGNSWAVSLGFTFANMTESTIGARMGRRRAGQGPAFIRLQGSGASASRRSPPAPSAPPCRAW